MAERAAFARLELPIRELMIGSDDRLIARAARSYCNHGPLPLSHGLPRFDRGRFESRQGKPGKGESYVDSGNSLMESSGFDSHPAKVSHQLEASLA
jgi:hypothetical protein